MSFSRAFPKLLLSRSVKAMKISASLFDPIDAFTLGRLYFDRNKDAPISCLLMLVIL